MGGWGFDPAGSHVGQELVRDLCQNVLGQPGHAQDVVPRSVDVVAERHKLQNREENQGQYNYFQGRTENQHVSRQLLPGYHGTLIKDKK